MLNPPVDEVAIDGSLQAGPRLTAWVDFQHARLRKFPRHGSKVEWREYFGHGREDVVFKATIGCGSPVALKVVRRLPPGRYPTPT